MAGFALAFSEFFCALDWYRGGLHSSWLLDSEEPKVAWLDLYRHGIYLFAFLGYNSAGDNVKTPPLVIAFSRGVAQLGNIRQYSML